LVQFIVETPLAILVSPHVGIRRVHTDSFWSAYPGSHLGSYLGSGPGSCLNA